MSRLNSTVVVWAAATAQTTRASDPRRHCARPSFISLDSTPRPLTESGAGTLKSLTVPARTWRMKATCLLCPAFSMRLEYDWSNKRNGKMSAPNGAALQGGKRNGKEILRRVSDADLSGSGSDRADRWWSH